MQPVKSCCAANFLCHVLKALFFIKIVQKLLFLQKNAKFSSAGATPPDPRAFGGWGFAPRIAHPHCEFLASRLDVSKQVKIYFI